MSNPLKAGPALIIGLVVAAIQAIAELIKAVKEKK